MTFPTRQVTATFNDGQPLENYSFHIELLTVAATANGEIAPPLTWHLIAEDDGTEVFNLPVPPVATEAYLYKIRYDSGQEQEFSLSAGDPINLATLLSSEPMGTPGDGVAADLAHVHEIRIGGKSPLSYPLIADLGGGVAEYTTEDAFLAALGSHVGSNYTSFAAGRLNSDSGIAALQGSSFSNTLTDIATAAPTAGLSGSGTVAMTQEDALENDITVVDTDWEANINIRLGDSDDFASYQSGLLPLGEDLTDIGGTWETIEGYISPGGSMGGSFTIDWDGLSDEIEFERQVEHVEAVDNYDNAVFDTALETRINDGITAGSFDTTLQADINTALTAAGLDTLPTFAAGQRADVLYSVVTPNGAVAVASLEIAST